MNCKLPYDDESCVSTKVNLKLDEIFEYFGCGKRSLKAARELLDAGFIYAIGIAPPPSLGIIGLVVQTSSMNSSPHEVKLHNLEDKCEHWQCSCTCKAGTGEKCKHTAACLLHIFRFPYLRPVSCTELKQSWGKSGRKDMTNQFNVVSVKDLCCIGPKLKRPFQLADAQRLTINKNILAVAQECEANKMLNTTRTVRPINIEPQLYDEFEKYFSILYSYSGLSNFVRLMESLIQSHQIDKFYLKVVTNDATALKICTATITQTSALWLLERKSRITGSIAYNLYTYSKNRNPNWRQKIESVYNGNFKGNEHTRYGLYAEKLAKKGYGMLLKTFNFGPIISKLLPLFAVSPDGISLCNGEWRLIEIKCPAMGREQRISDFIRKLSYIKRDENTNICVNPKHKYYGQVQLGLAITNLVTCDLIIYGSHSNDFYVVQKR